MILRFYGGKEQTRLLTFMWDCRIVSVQEALRLRRPSPQRPCLTARSHITKRLVLGGLFKPRDIRNRESRCVQACTDDILRIKLSITNATILAARAASDCKCVHHQDCLSLSSCY